MKHSSLVGGPLGQRRRFTAKERQQWVEGWKRSQQTQVDFATEQGLSVGTLRNWVRRAGSGGTQQADPPKFVEVDLDRLVGPPGSSGAWEFEVRTPRGWVVAVASGAPVERLQAVLEVLRC